MGRISNNLRIANKEARNVADSHDKGGSPKKPCGKYRGDAAEFTNACSNNDTKCSTVTEPNATRLLFSSAIDVC